LLRLLAGLEPPREGVAWRAERRGERGPAAALALEYPERQLIGRTVLEDAGMALWVEGAPREERERLALRALSAAGLPPEKFASRVPSTLSEGEKRRVALAGLFAEPAPLLLLDEPTAGLDPEGRRALRTALDALRSRERTIVLASHDLDFVHAMADRVILLAREEDGPAWVARDGAPRDVFRDRPALADAGIPPPDVVALEEALRAAALLPSSSAARDVDELVDLLARSLADRTSDGTSARAAADVRAGAA
jgi:energy-coupling factor transport system ATP-binding protein